MADDISLNPGTGGDTVRALQDEAGVKHPAQVVAYAATIAAGANVLQVVDAAHGLPVILAGSVVVDQITGPVSVVNADPTELRVMAQQDGAYECSQAGTWNVASVTSVGSITNTVSVGQSNETALKATVHQGGTWSVGLAPGAEVALAAGATVAVSGTVPVSGTIAATQSGTWTVASVTNPVAATQSGAWSAGLNAGTNLIGKTSAGADTGAIYNGTTALAPVFAKITASASGANAIVAAQGSGKKIRVLRWSVTSSGAVNAKWQSGSTDLTGLRYLTQFASAGGAYCPVGVFETAANEALNLNLSAAVAVGGELTYVVV